MGIDCHLQLIQVFENYESRTWYYQDRGLANQIYGICNNRNHCKEPGICPFRISTW